MRCRDLSFRSKTNYMPTAAKLKWVTTPVKQGFQSYELWNEEHCLVSLSINPFSQTTILQCADSRRQFKIEKEGFLRSRTIIKNEYGVKIGQLGLDNWFSDNGYVDFNMQRFHFQVTQNNPRQIIIYKHHSRNPLIICELSQEIGMSSNAIAQTDELDKSPCLLMAICWFMFMPAGKQYAVETAA